MKPSKPPGCRSSASDEKRLSALCMESSTLRRDTAWAMSQENVENFRRGSDALERGGLDGALIEELIDPDVIFEPLRAPVSGAYRGYEGIRQFIADTAESFEVFRFDRPDIRD